MTCTSFLQLETKAKISALKLHLKLKNTDQMLGPSLTRNIQTLLLAIKVRYYHQNPSLVRQQVNLSRITKFS